MKATIMLSCLALMVVGAVTPVRICGRQLADLRMLVCYGNKEMKRTLPPVLMVQLDGESNAVEDWPWKGRRGSLIASRQKYKRVGLADECCVKGCAIEIIQNYC